MDNDAVVRSARAAPAEDSVSARIARSHAGKHVLEGEVLRVPEHFDLVQPTGGKKRLHAGYPVIARRGRCDLAKVRNGVHGKVEQAGNDRTMAVTVDFVLRLMAKELMLANHWSHPLPIRLESPGAVNFSQCTQPFGQ